MRELIIEGNRNASAHASTLAVLPDGSVYAAWFDGKEGENYTIIHGSIKRPGKFWEIPTRRIADVGTRKPHWNPVLFYDKILETLTLWFKVGDSPRDWETYWTTSIDDGETWVKPIKWLGHDKQSAPVRSKPIQLSTGTLIAGGSTEKFYQDDTGRRGHYWRAFVDVYYGGDSYEHKKRIDIQSDVNLIQPTLWQCHNKPNIIGMLLRSDVGYIYAAFSYDFGLTWTAAYNTKFPNNNSGIDVVNNEGDLYVVCNPVFGRNIFSHTRSPLTIFKTDENLNKEWYESVNLATGGGEFSYPAMVLDKKYLHISYTYNRKNIAYHKIHV